MIKTENIKSFFEGLSFKEDIHKYFFNDVVLGDSVSNLLKRFVIQENWEEIATNVASKTNKTKEQVLSEWAENSRLACLKGTEVHLTAEVIANSIKSNKEAYQYKIYDNPQEFYVESFLTTLPPFIKIVGTEILMFHKKYLFPGTMDLLLFDERDGKYIIADYKTNKDLFKNFAGKKLLSPFNFLLDNDFNKYQLQLSYYQILIEQVEGIKIKARKIIHVGENNSNFVIHNTEDYSLQLLDILENDYKRNNTESSIPI